MIFRHEVGQGKAMQDKIVLINNNDSDDDDDNDNGLFSFNSDSWINTKSIYVNIEPES